ncbi:MAG: hypothetical protein JWN66_3749 [Sphingomonas bacterium]|uniref:hypothetical protein n=1 Tax=Sphingomonas bacterium TaxID=1895847 RepID=UPI00262645FB|nr:hypothetical protein [Sphingomonas bacterium]MDB5706633.1 hypothetical protein [Sphingomonas bacterium]
MQSVLKIVDERFGTGAGERRPALELRLVSERITARDLIRRRIADEVETANRQRADFAAGHARSRSFLIPLGDDAPEVRLNTPSARPAGRARLFDEQAEFDRAITAFEQRVFILLFDDRQVEELDEAIALTPESEAVFLYLTPLVGG